MSVTGNVTASMLKPLPVSVAAVIVTGAGPVDFRVKDCVATVLTVTSPKARLLVLRLKVPLVAALAVTGFSCRAKLRETPPALAISVAAWAEATEKTFAEKPTLVALVGTRTDPATVTAALLLTKLILTPPLGAGPLNVAVQRSVPAPVMDALLHERLFNVGSAAVTVPIPLRLTTAGL